MSRIRSIHPGFRIDAAFVSISRDARLFYILLLGECDDQGIFEWKPLDLKMAIFPGDNVDITAFLSELESIKAIKSYEMNGRQLGVVRNFRKYQRPKSPKARYLKPDDWDAYVGLTQDISEQDGAELPPRVTKRRNVSADGGDKMEEEGGKKDEAAASGGSGQYVFEGKIIRLNRKNYDEWAKAYFAIPDLKAELTSLDTFYDKELAGKDRDNWFIRCSTALAKKHQEWVAKTETEKRRAQPNGPHGRAWA